MWKKDMQKRACARLQPTHVLTPEASGFKCLDVDLLDVFIF
jgi:hypothetical protein